MEKLKVMKSIKTWSPWPILPSIFLFLVALSACTPTFKDPEQAGEAIYESLVRDDVEYLEAIMPLREDLNQLYEGFDPGTDAALTAVLDSFYTDALDALPGAMDGFRQQANEMKINMSKVDFSSAESYSEDSDFSKNVDAPVYKVIVWVRDEDIYDRYVLVIRHLVRVNNRWVMAYPEFKWMTSEAYYASDYGDEYDYDEDAEAVEEVEIDY